MATPVPQYILPIAARPPKTWFQFIHGVIALAVYLTGCIMINATQLLFVVPLYLLPGKRVRALHDEGVRYTKGAFGKLITFMCQVFGPTTLRVTFESEGLGAFTPEQIEQIIVRNSSGKVVELRMPQKMVIISNHQMYADWWYVWCLTYFMNMHRDVFIVLKRSLKWIPILGWGMQVFRFIFLARSWASDKHVLVSRLAKLGRKAQLEDTPLAFIIYPEGTVVSDNTRPVSKKYADKLGVPDMTYTLMPRSTGLHFSLRALAPRIPALKLLDITVAYPGIPPMADGQLYYTIRSIFMDRVPPPTIHMHLRLIDVASAVPIGDLTGTNPAVTPPATAAAAAARPPTYPSSNNAINGDADPVPAMAVEADVPEKERLVFDEWVRALWRVKDETLEKFHQSGGPSSPKDENEKTGEKNTLQDDGPKMFASSMPALEIPLELRHASEVLDVFCFLVPGLLGWAWHKASR